MNGVCMIPLLKKAYNEAYGMLMGMTEESKLVRFNTVLELMAMLVVGMLMECLWH